jgi:hypothetical protein
MAAQTIPRIENGIGSKKIDGANTLNANENVHAMAKLQASWSGVETTSGNAKQIRFVL